MKKLFLTMVLAGVVAFGFAQQQKLAHFYPSQMIYEQLTPTQVEQMRSENPADLLQMNYRLVNSAVVIAKPLDGDVKQMSSLEKYLPEGMSYDEDEIIRNGALNPYKWKLPQDKTQWCVYPMRRSGYFVAVPPETVFNERMQAFLKSYGF